MFDYFDDKAIPRQGRMDMLRLRNYAEACARAFFRSRSPPLPPKTRWAASSLLR